MDYPDFYNDVLTVELYDPLAEFLGAFERGRITYSYLDAVRLAGHSCPTVAGAYLMTVKALQALYPQGCAERGNLRAEFARSQSSGVTGVIASVVGLLTGAAAEGGFKGLAGRFERRDKLLFGLNLAADMRLTRLDTAHAVTATVELRHVPVDPQLSGLLALCMEQRATAQQEQQFRRLWQQRVRAILIDYADNEDVCRIRPASADA